MTNRRAVSIALFTILAIALPTFLVSQFVQPILPSEINSAVVLLVLAIIGTVAVLAGFNDIMELVKKLFGNQSEKHYTMPSNSPEVSSSPSTEIAHPEKGFEGINTDYCEPSQKTGSDYPKLERLIKLYEVLVERFDEEGLITLCFYLGVDYDSLQGKEKTGKARELIKYLDLRGQIPKLVKTGKQQRPDIDWDDHVRAASQVQSDSPPQRFSEPETILIPAGEFLMGSDPIRDQMAYENEQPQHSLYLPDFYLAKTPVTNAQYADFIKASGYRQPDYWPGRKPPPDKQDHPVTCVSWHDAMTYCRWLAEMTDKPYRLPSAAEWEKGARGNDGRIYPWGDDWEPEWCNTSEGNEGDTTPVGAYFKGASFYGLLDMAGNVWEWTISLWGTDVLKLEFKYPYKASDGREYLEAGNNVFRIMRGGAFDYDQSFVHCANMSRSAPYFRNYSIGFRVVNPIIYPPAPIQSDAIWKRSNL